jgi:hypothetical protein
MGTSSLFEDQELFADYWTLYYTDYEPESIWIVELDGSVVGYCFGCVDTARYMKNMAVRIMPALLLKVMWRWLCGKYQDKNTHRFLKWLVRRSWREAPPVPIQAYPAHYHLNVLPPAYKKLCLSSLSLVFLDYLEKHGIGALHVHALEREEGGIYKQLEERFTTRFGVPPNSYYAEKPSSLFREVLGIEEKMVNRVWGTSVAEHRNLLHWVRDRYHL